MQTLQTGGFPKALQKKKKESFIVFIFAKALKSCRPCSVCRTDLNPVQVRGKTAGSECVEIGMGLLNSTFLD